MSGADSQNGRERMPVEQLDHHKHMDYVQAIIARLATNSFVMKGWALTVSSALLGFSASKGLWALAALAVVPAAAFWFLDTYYLRQERAFRDMYEDVAAKRVTGFKIKPGPYASRHSWGRTGKSLSLSVFYGPIVVVCVLVAVIMAAVDASADPKDDHQAPRACDEGSHGPIHGNATGR